MKTVLDILKMAATGLVDAADRREALDVLLAYSRDYEQIKIGGIEVAPDVFRRIEAEVGDNRVNAIKLMRETTGLGLKEAKVAIDEQWPTK